MNFIVFKDFKQKKGDPISSSELKSFLDQNLTSELQQLGLNKYDNEYLWFSEFNEIGVRLVFKYMRLKGDTGVFNWGYCFGFLPTISNTKKLKNHKTENNITLHLWESTDGYKNSFQGGGRPTEIVSHYSGECENDIQTIFNKYKSVIFDWCASSNSLSKIQDIVLDQIQNNVYNMHTPNPKYVLPFILAKSGKKDEGLDLIGKYFAKYIERDESWKIVLEELESKLKSC